MKRLSVYTGAQKANRFKQSLLSLSAITLGLSSLLFSYNLLAQDSQAKSQSEQSYQQALFSQAELEQMLAPIALYPDSVLTHILIASTYPIEIIQASRWLDKNADLDASDALEEVEDKEWDPSVKALVAFPRVLERLSNDLDWTQNLGDAFLQDEKSVLDSIQSLRNRADQAGNLDKMENVKVSRENKTIIIQSAEPEVIYVPYYDTRVVYGHWHWAHHQPIYWDWTWHNSHNHYGHHYTPHYGLFSWHPRIHLRHHFYFSAFNWHNHHVVVVNGRHYNSRRYRHRSDIIAHANARRWDHNPKHRRGVAYRNNQVRERFSSSRPSRTETRAVRTSERNVVRSQSTERNSNARSNNRTSNNQITTSQNRSNNERRVNNQSTTRESTSRTERNTRSQRLREQLSNDRNTQTNDRSATPNQRDSRVIRTDNRSTRSEQQPRENARQVRETQPIQESRPVRETRPAREVRPEPQVRSQRETRARQETRSRPQRESRPVRESRSRNEGRRSRGDRGDRH